MEKRPFKIGELVELTVPDEGQVITFNKNGPRYRLDYVSCFRYNDVCDGFNAEEFIESGRSHVNLEVGLIGMSLGKMEGWTNDLKVLVNDQVYVISPDFLESAKKDETV